LALSLCVGSRDAGRQTLTNHQDAATFVSFSPAGSLLASAGLDDTVMLWNVRTGELMRTLKVPTPKWSGVLQVAYSPDGKTLATGSHDGKVSLWDVSGVR
jgi:WD40 repeat protein